MKCEKCHKKHNEGGYMLDMVLCKNCMDSIMQDLYCKTNDYIKILKDYILNQI